MIVISSNYVLSPAAAAADPDLPAVGYHNVVRADSIVVDTQEENYPASNLANPATHLEWRAADDSEQYITITTNEVDPIDYVGIARHNLGTAEIVVSVEANIDAVWTEIVEETMLPDDTPAVLRFAAASYSQVRIRLQTGSDAARIAVVYCGKLLDLERKVWVGHTPLPYARKIDVASNRSVSGNFLGRIILGEGRESTIPLSLFTPSWYRANMDAFLVAAQEIPFFFAWRPSTYPNEVGFCDLVDDPMPTPVGPSNLLAFDLKVNGVA
jgi:hypothetical protein